MRILIILSLLLSVYVSCALAADGTPAPQFSDYPSKIYSGKSHIPSYYKKSGDVWRDDMGKAVSSPEVNFAGKYYVGVHSCGTECRYYTLSNLATGQDSNALEMFSSDGQSPSRTKDGRTYVTNLVTRSDSRMFVAQYHVDESQTKPAECREKVFILSEDGKKAMPITDTKIGCHKF